MINKKIVPKILMITPRKIEWRINRKGQPREQINPPFPLVKGGFRGICVRIYRRLLPLFGNCKCVVTALLHLHVWAIHELLIQG